MTSSQYDNYHGTNRRIEDSNVNGATGNNSAASLGGRDGRRDSRDDYPYSRSGSRTFDDSREAGYDRERGGPSHGIFGRNGTRDRSPRRDRSPDRRGDKVTTSLGYSSSLPTARPRSRSPGGHYDFRDKRHSTPPRSYDGNQYGRSGDDSSRYRSTRDVDSRSYGRRPEYRPRSRSPSATRRYDLRTTDHQPSSDHYRRPGYVAPPHSIGARFGSSELGAKLFRPSAGDFDAAPPIKKSFYDEHPAVKAKSEAQIEEFRRIHNMTFNCRDVPRPVESFEEACFPDYINKILLNQGFSKPTPIQSQV